MRCWAGWRTGSISKHTRCPANRTRPVPQEHLDDDQVLDWLAQAEVAVQLGPGEGGAAAAAGPGKELPLWFRGGGAGARAAWWQGVGMHRLQPRGAA